jgi:7-carboxy-7-deazaguanine synthase
LIKLCEIFLSIQGESTYAGMPCVFIRLGGCNLRCNYCDTTYAYDEGVDRTVSSIVAEAKALGVNMVEVTGGEPLMQPDTPLLVKALLDEGLSVLVETNGSMDISQLDDRAIVIMDIKTPGSGEGGSFKVSNIDFLSTINEVKFVISDRKDYIWAKGFINKHKLDSKATVLLSPAFKTLEPALLAGWIIEDKLVARLNLQIHKYIYDPDERGV